MFMYNHEVRNVLSVAAREVKVWPLCPCCVLRQGEGDPRGCKGSKQGAGLGVRRALPQEHLGLLTPVAEFAARARTLSLNVCFVSPQV